MLNPALFQRIQHQFPSVNADLFASRLTFQLPRFFSWRPDPLVEATDAFLQNWKGLKGYANPPWNLIGRVLMKVENQAADLVLEAPVWPSQPWYPKLLSLLVSPPLRISLEKEVMIQVGRGATSRDNPAPSRVEYLRQHYAHKRISGEATELLLASWRRKSSQSYNSLCKKWISWCTGRGLDPVSGPIEDVVNFLPHLYAEGSQYRSLGSYRLAIASMHALVDGVSVGQHPLVSRLLRGVFHSRPPLPRYSGTWDVAKVLAFLNGHDLEDSNFPLKLLTL